MLSLKKLISIEDKKQKDSMDSLRYRRLNWTHAARNTVESEFGKFVQESRSTDFPVKFYVTSHPQRNEEQMQISTERRPTGVFSLGTGPLGLPDYSTGAPLFEQGASLVVSQSAWGTVSFIAYPFSSDRVRPNQKELILYYDLDPLDIDIKLVRKVLKKYLVLIRHSSVWSMHDSYSWQDRLSYFLMEIQDVRMKVKMTKSVLRMENEWLKILVPLILGAFGGFVSSKFQ